jgi:RNA polymerase sigma-70 factor (ECF subfamily)
MSAHIDEPTDERLIQSTLAGDDEAFAELARRHKRKVFGIAARFARNDAELNDICQEIFVKAYQNLKGFRGEAPFEHWVSRIAVRSCYDFLRAARRDRENVTLDGIEIGVQPDGNVEHAREAAAMGDGQTLRARAAGDYAARTGRAVGARNGGTDALE